MLCQKNNGYVPEDLSPVCQKLINSYIEVIADIRDNSKNSEDHVRYGLFDIGENTHHVYNVVKDTPFLRMYKANHFDKTVETRINDLKDIKSELTHFVLENLEYEHHFDLENSYVDEMRYAMEDL